MKVLNNRIEKDEGSITLLPQDNADMWHLYNLIQVGDTVTSKTMRKMQQESTTGAVKSERILVTLTIEVKKVDFDAELGELRLNGVITVEKEGVRLGSYHRIDLEAHRKFTLYKSYWDSVAYETLKEALNPQSKSDIGAIVLQEGLANLCLLTEHTTILRNRIETSIPRKQRGSVTNHEKGMQRFYDTIYNTMLRNFDLDKLKVILVASPGFIGEGLIKYIFDQALKSGNQTLLKSRSKFVKVHSTSGHLHALNEVLKSPEVRAQLADTRFAKESLALDRFFQMLNEDESRAWYGSKEVEIAVQHSAVGTLLISDDLFRSNSIPVRKKYVEMVEAVKSQGGQVLIFSSMHESGKQLDQITGIAAILTFPLPDIEDIEVAESA